MSEKTEYSQIIEAKDGNLIPLCRKPGSEQEVALHSKYNPKREAEGFCSGIDGSCLFFIVLGLAGGYHIEKLHETVPKAKILVVENSENAISFLMQIPQVRAVSELPQVYITDEARLKDSVLSLYKPAIHGNLTILSLRQWEAVFQDNEKKCKSIIQEAIQFLAADFSVQSHFGKIWQKNIFLNLALAGKTKSFSDIRATIPGEKLKKTAAIIAAGPSLNQSLQELKLHRDEYFVIATDTAFSALSKQGLACDAVVSIDGQMVSHQHYMEDISGSPIFVFDLCANPSAVRKVLERSCSVLLSESGHPLAQYASLFSGIRHFLHLESGSGTVTIAAASFAKALGFLKFRFFGADFSFIDGQPYCRGTYLETQFHGKSTRLSSAEQSYSALMFRTPLTKIAENIMTSEVLTAYKNSLDDFMKRKDEPSPENTWEPFDIKAFKAQYCKELKKAFKSEDQIDENSYALTTLLPLCAKMGKGAAFLAYLKTLRYTELL